MSHLVDQPENKNHEFGWSVLGIVILAIVLASIIGFLNYFISSMILKSTISYLQDDSTFRSNTIFYVLGALFKVLAVLGYGIFQFIGFGFIGLMIIARSNLYHNKLLGRLTIIISAASAVIYYLALYFRYALH